MIDYLHVMADFYRLIKLSIMLQGSPNVCQSRLDFCLIFDNTRPDFIFVYGNSKL